MFRISPLCLSEFKSEGLALKEDLLQPLVGILANLTQHYYVLQSFRCVQRGCYFYIKNRLNSLDILNSLPKGVALKGEDRNMGPYLTKERDVLKGFSHRLASRPDD